MPNLALEPFTFYLRLLLCGKCRIDWVQPKALRKAKSMYSMAFYKQSLWTLDVGSKATVEKRYSALSSFIIHLGVPYSTHSQTGLCICNGVESFKKILMTGPTLGILL